MRDKFRTYRTSPVDREPLIRFMLDALRGHGCRIISEPSPDSAPFRITFETPQGERLGIVAYAFLANNKKIKNRPEDEHRFQIKYGGDLSGFHEIWQDPYPYGLYVTLLLGINPEIGFFVAADPVLRSSTRFSVSVEFKDRHVKEILARHWLAWERERRSGKGDEPLFEALVGGTADQLLQLIRFEREVWGEAPGERHYIAEKFGKSALVTASRALLASAPAMPRDELHALALEFDLPESRVLDLIAERRMLKMAVRGSVAEEHLVSALRYVPGVRDCRRIEDEHGPDVALSYRGKAITVECKNSSRVRTKEGYEKIDLQRTRAAKSDPCSRYYRPSEFDLVAACIHAVTERWEFKYALTADLDAHKICAGRLSNNVKLDERWVVDAESALQRIAG